MWSRSRYAASTQARATTLGAVLWAEIALVALDDRVDLVGREQPLLHEHRFERRCAQRELVVVLMGVIGAHAGLR